MTKINFIKTYSGDIRCDVSPHQEAFGWIHQANNQFFAHLNDEPFLVGRHRSLKGAKARLVEFATSRYPDATL